LACSACSSPLRVGFLPEDATDGSDDGASGSDGGSTRGDAGASAPDGDAAPTEDAGDEATDGAADAPTGDEATLSDAQPAMDAKLADGGAESVGDAEVDATVGGEADDATAEASTADAFTADVVTEDAMIGDATLGDGASGGGGMDATGEATLEEGSADATLDAGAIGSADGAGATADDAPSEALADAGGAGDATAATTDAGDAGLFDASADAGVVAPVLSGGHYVFSWGNLLLEIDPQTGGRVLTFSLAGQNVLTGPSANAINYGSTFWTSPQSDWVWPPVPEIDNLPYTASVDGGTLTLRGSTSAALGVAITKAFSVNASTGAVSIAYSIANAASAARSFAPWEVTRVRPAGLMFFPTGSTAYSADSGPPMPTTQAAGATWFDADTAATSADTKFFATAARGWIAQASAGLLFVKKFPDASAGPAAPGEAEVEMFASGDRAYVELESQGAYTSIMPGGALSWTTTWFLTALPADVDAGLGSASLVSLVDAL
jgi:hypothetical protein